MSRSTELSPQQHEFLDREGYLLIKGFLRPDEVEGMRAEIDRIARRWTESGRKSINGIPIFYGRDHLDQPFLQRMAYTSCFSDYIREIISDGRFDPILALVGPDARIGEIEKDGVVVNRYMNVSGSVYPRLGWHTDGLKDIFYLRKPKPMLNIGLHFDHVSASDGGLRLIPGTHRQSMVSTVFSKPYFIDHRPDPREVVVETEPGDLTVHDGRLWHRVARSSKTGPESLRRTMYIPFINDAPNPRNEHSSTPAYHHLARAMRGSRMAWYHLQRRLGRA